MKEVICGNGSFRTLTSIVFDSTWLNIDIIRIVFNDNNIDLPSLETLQFGHNSFSGCTKDQCKIQINNQTVYLNTLLFRSMLI